MTKCENCIYYNGKNEEPECEALECGAGRKNCKWYSGKGDKK